VGLFCSEKDNAYYAPRTEVSRNMHSILLARSHARKHDGNA
jgi:hypothetical protein